MDLQTPEFARIAAIANAIERLTAQLTAPTPLAVARLSGLSFRRVERSWAEAWLVVEQRRAQHRRTESGPESVG